MRVLVTGGAGFIGSHLVDALVADGVEVVAFDDGSTGTPLNLPAAAELVQEDIADSSAVAAAARGCELVFHLAARGSVLRSVEDPLATDTANVHGSITVLKAALGLTLGGLAIGLGGAIALGQVLSKELKPMLYQVEPVDAATLVCVSVMLAFVAIATWANTRPANGIRQRAARANQVASRLSPLK